MIQFFRFDRDYKKNKKRVLFEIDKVLSSGKIFLVRKLINLKINLINI